MKKNTFLLFIITFAFSTNFTNAQVGIGITSPNAALDITSTNDGLLIPRISLTATNIATVVTPTTGELVFNTATSAPGANQVTPGFYYWDDVLSLWIRIPTGNSSDWTTTGNTGTTAGSNFIGTTDAQDFVGKTNGIERFRVLSTGNTGFGTTTPASAVSIGANATIGTDFAPLNAAPTNGLRVQGQTVINKASGEDARDQISSHTSATAFQSITGYPNNAKKRAIAGYADDSGIGIFGFSNRTGYGVVGLTQPGTISSFVQTGEGVLGQADGASGVANIPVGVHGIIDESVSGLLKATPVLGENNNITSGTGLGGGAYNSSAPASAAVYGNYATRVNSAGTNSYQFGVVGDILLLGAATQPDASGGVLGTSASGDFGILGYKTKAGTNYSVYAGNTNSTFGNGTGRASENNTPNNNIGLGVNGGFMGGYIKGNQYGLLTQGSEFGMYVQGKTITNQPILQLSDTNNSQRTITYATTSTEVDITTRGKGKLTNGECYIAFKEAFKNVVSNPETINITITPTGETKGVFISKVTNDGFFVKENEKGTSNTTFNWIAIGTQKGYENGVEISKTILATDFDKNMNETMHNDGSATEGKPIYFDGQNVKFERIPEGIIKYNKKEAPKK